MTNTPSRGSLKSFIRFQLSQLSVGDGHHEFELLSFDLARIRVASNLLPATGPVQAGGDQGRDFESYRTFLANSPIAGSSFAAKASNGLIVGACTLNKQTESKIRSDLNTIFSHGEAPTHVYYFCEPDVPVAKRHELIAYCGENYGARLEIFDGNSIADMLADADARQIALEYLDIPSELWPTESSLHADYIAARMRWLSQQEAPTNYADFSQIKSGLRTATFNEEAKSDLSG